MLKRNIAWYMYRYYDFKRESYVCLNNTSIILIVDRGLICKVYRAYTQVWCITAFKFTFDFKLSTALLFSRFYVCVMLLVYIIGLENLHLNSNMQVLVITNNHTCICLFIRILLFITKFLCVLNITGTVMFMYISIILSARPKVWRTYLYVFIV